MALSDLAVFSEYTYETMMETLDQQIELFNASTNGAIILQNTAHQGDYSDTAFWARIPDLIRRRNVYGDASIAERNLEHLVDTMVKVAAGTFPVRTDPAWFTWIQHNEQLGGVLYGRQLAQDMLQDMLNTSIMCAVVALSGESEVVHQAHSGTANHALFNTAQAKFGDRFESIAVWVMHSKPLFDIYGAALANNESLFSYGTVNVRRDPFGRPYIISDSPSLFESEGVDENIDLYRMLGLTSGAILVHRNNDFDQNVQTQNRFENIVRTIQSEWTYNLGIKGFAWDKTNGGKSPSNAALAVATNWDRVATSHKDLAGVMVETQ